MFLILACARHNGQIIEGLSNQEVPSEKLSSRFQDFGKAWTGGGNGLSEPQDLDPSINTPPRQPVIPMMIIESSLGCDTIPSTVIQFPTFPILCSEKSMIHLNTLLLHRINHLIHGHKKSLIPSPLSIWNQYPV